MKLIGDTEGELIVGRRGSGKTQEALAHLSCRDFSAMPHIVIDHKGDDLCSRIPVTDNTLTIHDAPPVDPGLYVIKAEIEDGDAKRDLSNYLLRIYQQGHTFVMIDEGIMAGQHNRGLRALITQGRSRHCPMIALSQRPVFMDKYLLTEMEYIQVFHLQSEDDQTTMTKYLPKNAIDFDALRDMGKHYSYRYETRENDLQIMEPGPSFQEIYDRILAALPHYIEPHVPGPEPRDRV